MSPSILSDAEVASRVLAAADRLFYIRGIAEVTMAQIRDASGVSMRRLYGFAPSKSNLVAKWLEHRHLAWTNGFTERVDDYLAAGIAPVAAIFDALAAWMTATDFRGCGFINTHAESSELAAEHRGIIRQHKAELAEYLDFDGAIVQASIFESVEPIRQAQIVAQALHTPTIQKEPS